MGGGGDAPPGPPSSTTMDDNKLSISLIQEYVIFLQHIIIILDNKKISTNLQ